MYIFSIMILSEQYWNVCILVNPLFLDIQFPLFLNINANK